ncbi:MAG: HAD family hydrolase [Candidatus Thorarchaeota archaeon]
MIKNIIFDLGNVLINFKPEQFLLRYTKDKNRITKFISNIIQSDTWLKLDRGIISIKNARDDFISAFPEETELIKTFFNHWKEILIPISKNVSLLKELKSNGYKLYVLSNYIIEAFEYVKERYDIFSLFDGLAISGKLNIIKPEQEIFQYLLQNYNLNPEDSIFIDDIEQFISEARKLKIKTIHYLPNTDLQIELRKLGVII